MTYTEAKETFTELSVGQDIIRAIFYEIERRTADIINTSSLDPADALDAAVNQIRFELGIPK